MQRRTLGRPCPLSVLTRYVYILGTGWLNAEYRTYVFESENDSEDPNAGIRETEESRVRRGKSGSRLNREEQIKLYKKATGTWEGMGWQDPMDVARSEAEGTEIARGDDGDISTHTLDVINGGLQRGGTRRGSGVVKVVG